MKNEVRNPDYNGTEILMSVPISLSSMYSTFSDIECGMKKGISDPQEWFNKPAVERLLNYSQKEALSYMKVHSNVHHNSNQYISQLSQPECSSIFNPEKEGSVSSDDDSAIEISNVMKQRFINSEAGIVKERTSMEDMKTDATKLFYEVIGNCDNLKHFDILKEHLKMANLEVTKDALPLTASSKPDGHSMFLNKRSLSKAKDSISKKDKKRSKR